MQFFLSCDHGRLRELNAIRDELLKVDIEVVSPVFGGFSPSYNGPWPIPGDPFQLPSDCTKEQSVSMAVVIDAMRCIRSSDAVILLPSSDAIGTRSLGYEAGIADANFVPITVVSPTRDHCFCHPGVIRFNKTNELIDSIRDGFIIKTAKHLKDHARNARLQLASKTIADQLTGR